MTRLTPEREAEIRNLPEVLEMARKYVPGCGIEHQRDVYDLLAEIDALREENRKLRDNAGDGPLLPPLYI